MSVTMSRTDGVTVFTLTSDPDSHWPPLCQILKSLCYSPVCCSVSQQLRTVLKTSLSVLGAIHMMIGLLNTGLGVIVQLSYVSPYFYSFSFFPYWMGTLFIMFGILCILSEKYPSPCLLILHVFANLVAGAFAIAAIVFYSILEGDAYVWLNCDDRSYYYNDDYYRRTTPSPSSDAAYLKKNCLEGKLMIQMLQRAVIGVLIVLSVVELCVAISCVVLGIKALRRSSNKPDKTSDEPEYFKPLLEEVTTNPAV